jgi:formylglycine-generating enzyme required for sulfatase activity
MRPHWLGAALILASACQGDPEQRPQWTVTLSTDAQLPRFGDRLLIELLRENGEPFCSACRRTFDASQVAAFPLSFGVTPTTGNERVLLRARLHRAAYVGPGGLPAGPALIDASGFLPAKPGPVHVALAMDCFGVGDDDPRTSCDPSTRALGPAPEFSESAALLAAGTWPPGRAVDCPSAPPDATVCVPGGAFLLGAINAPPDPVELGLSPVPERLVQISPYFLDVDEVRVRDVRSIAAALPFPPTSQAVGTNPHLDCTYRDDGQNDDLPVNCVDHALAIAICDRLGKRLPTEAEWEYAATAGGDGPERAFPWGEDDAVCDHTVIAAGVSFDQGQDRSCLAGDLLILPGLREGGHDGDRSPLSVANLAGNLSEWVLDDFAKYEDPCWTTAPLLDPSCQIQGAPTASARGGAWSAPRIVAHSSTRKPQAKNSRLLSLGLRCARSAQ